MSLKSSSSAIIKYVLAFAVLAVAGIYGWLLLRAQEQTPPGYRAYRLQHAQAEVLASTLQEMLSGLNEAADVRVDDQQSDRLLVRGSDEAHRLTAEIIKTLDRPAAQPAVDEKLILKGYTVDARRRDALLEELRARYSNNARVRITSDPHSGQVLALATTAMHQKISQQLRGTEQFNDDRVAAERVPFGSPVGQDPSGGAVSREGEMVLRNITWRELEDELRRLWGEKLSVTTYNRGEQAMFRMPATDGVFPLVEVDRRKNLVRVKAPAKIVRPWMQLLAAIDKPRQRDGDKTQLVPLHKADPQNVRRAVTLMQTAGKRATAPVQDARAGIGRLAFFQNAQPGNGPPNNAQPGNGQPPAGNQDPQDEEGGLIGQVQIEFIPELGVFIVRGHERDVARVMKIIADIEKQSLETKPEIEIYVLRHANSQAVAEMIDQLYEEVFAPRQSDVSITALVKPNALLLIGRREALDSVIDLIGKLDTDVAANTRLAFFRLKYISAVDAETKINTFYGNPPVGGGGTTGTGTTQGQTTAQGLDVRVRVIADYRSNTLIVQASPRDLAEVHRLLEGLDVASSQAVNELKIIPLKNSLASELAPVLQEALTGQAAGAQPGVPPTTQPGTTTTSVATARSVVLQYMNLTTDGKKMLESGIMSDVRVTADSNSNALMVRAPAKSMDLIAAVVNALDQLPSAEAQIKIFEIENGDATNLQLMLQQLFGQTTTNQFGGAFGAFGQTGIQQAALQTAAAGESSLVALRFAVDLRTNTIIASGSASDLEVVEAILARLDEADIEARRTIVYRLKNAPSDDVAAALTNLLQQQTQVQQFGVQQQLVSPFEQIEREVIVVSEPVTNSLLVSATPRYFDQIREVIEELDVRPPMVMIQVLIAEVRLTDAYEFGVELGLQDSLLFDRGLASVGFPFNGVALGNDFSAEARATRNNLAGQAVSNFAMGRASPALGYGGFVLSAANESINVLVRALQDDGKLQILSRPQIMTLDNQPAFVQVGARVPRISTSNITPQGGTQSSTQDADVGLLLRVQPRISPDGQVVMLLDTEKSEVGPIAQGIPVAIDANGNVVNSPQINTTTAQTTISARSGQTVVFAGLITEERSSASRGVPWVKDLPVLGRFFEFEVETEERTELLIIMTPYVIKEDEDYEMIKAMESQRMSWSLADVNRVHGEVGLLAGPDPWCENVPIIYPDDDPTASQYMMPTSRKENGSKEQKTARRSLLPWMKKKVEDVPRHSQQQVIRQSHPQDRSMLSPAQQPGALRPVSGGEFIEQRIPSQPIRRDQPASSRRRATSHRPLIIEAPINEDAPVNTRAGYVERASYGQPAQLRPPQRDAYQLQTRSGGEFSNQQQYVRQSPNQRRVEGNDEPVQPLRQQTSRYNDWPAPYDRR